MKKNSSYSEKKKGDSELESLLHSEHIVQIEKLAVGGNGVARLLFKDKSIVVFIPLSAPNDQLKIKITRIEKNHLFGEVVQIIAASTSRRQAPCRYFEQCGGCSWQHINESEQLKQKELILKDLLKKFIPAVEYELSESVVSEKALHYRNRIQLKHFENNFGYFKKGSHEIVDIDTCLIADHKISEQIPILKSKLGTSKELKKYELRINHLNQFESYPIGKDGEGLSFSQVNNSVNSSLVDAAVNLISSKSPAFLTELYAGAGNFTFPILSAQPNVSVEAVEFNPKLTDFFTKKLLEQRLQKRLFVFTSDCETYVKRRKLSSEFILLDPPRSGCSNEVLDEIISSQAKNILYISCHPAYLARDLKKILSLRPEYKIEFIRIFDMFPQTDHFETLVLLSSNPSK